MAYTAVITHATGDVLPASDWNTYIRDNLAYLHGDGGATINVSAGGQIFLASKLSTGPLGTGAGGGGVAGKYLDNAGFESSVAAVATSSAFATSITTDTQFRFAIDHNGKMTWGPGGAAATDTDLYRYSGNTLGTSGAVVVGAGIIYAGSALDTVLTRVIGGELAVQNKVLEGMPATVNVAVPGTFTPNLATGLIQKANVPSGGASTLTIGAPTNPPSGTQTSLLVVQIVNNGGGTITLAWNAAFTANAGSTLALPTSRATATITEVLFVWDGSNWRLLAVG